MTTSYSYAFSGCLVTSIQSGACDKHITTLYDIHLGELLTINIKFAHMCM